MRATPGTTFTGTTARWWRRPSPPTPFASLGWSCFRRTSAWVAPSVRRVFQKATSVHRTATPAMQPSLPASYDCVLSHRHTKFTCTVRLDLSRPRSQKTLCFLFKLPKTNKTHLSTTHRTCITNPHAQLAATPARSRAMAVRIPGPTTVLCCARPRSQGSRRQWQLRCLPMPSRPRASQLHWQHSMTRGETPSNHTTRQSRSWRSKYSRTQWRRIRSVLVGRYRPAIPDQGRSRSISTGISITFCYINVKSQKYWEIF